MPFFAFGSADGTLGFGNAFDTSRVAPGVVGPASKFQVQPWPLNTCNQYLAQSPHSGVMNVGMADGSVRTISGAICGTVWWAALTPARSEVLGSDW